MVSYKIQINFAIKSAVVNNKQCKEGKLMLLGQYLVAILSVWYQSVWRWLSKLYYFGLDYVAGSCFNSKRIKNLYHSTESFSIQ